MNGLPAFPAILLLGALAAQEPVPAKILEATFAPSADELLGHVQFLASDVLGGRLAGTAEGAVAAAYIAAELRKLGLQPAGDEGGFEQRIDAVALLPGEPGADGRNRIQRRKVTYRNVLAWLPGKDEDLAEEFILVGAHFDHLGVRGETIHNGADDNASGVAGLLGVARALVHGARETRRSVLFVAFDAEEIGLRGSDWFARHPPRSLQKLVAMINLDMIGRGTFLDLGALALPKKLIGLKDRPAVGMLGSSKSPALAAIARAVCAADDLPLHAPEGFPAVLRDVIEKQAAGRSDHAPFEQRKIPFLFFSTSENDDYHKPSDTIDKVDPQVLRRIAQAVYRVVLAIDARDERPAFVEAPAKERDR
jgi:hypothetical protein